MSIKLQKQAILTQMNLCKIRQPGKKALKLSAVGAGDNSDCWLGRVSHDFFSDQWGWSKSSFFGLFLVTTSF